jgi:RHS repeat-associated protein
MKILPPATRTLSLLAVCALAMIGNSAERPRDVQSTVKADQAPKRLKAIPKESQGPVILRISSSPSAKELRQFPGLYYKLGTIDGSDGSKTERSDLGAALNAMQNKGATFAPLERFIQAHSTGAWTPSVKLNLGQLVFDRGYFSRALSLWKEASDSAAQSSTAEAKRIFSEALAQYAHLIATVGRKDELAVIASKTDLSIITPGPATTLNGAFEGLETMENRPGTAFRCGTYALVSMQQALYGVADHQILDRYPSPNGGFTLLQVEEMAGKSNLPLIAVKRLAGTPLVIPSIVHWKVNHFGALIRQEGDRVLLRDPTFGRDHWVDANAVDTEASGYFLIPSVRMDHGWAAASLDEKKTIAGRGFANMIDRAPGADSSCNDGCCSAAGVGEGIAGEGAGASNGDKPPMAVSSLSNRNATLIVRDTPIGYQAAFGPSPKLRLVYHEAETRDLSTEPVSGFGYYWNCNWVGYVQDDPSINNSPATVWLAGGGFEEVGSPDATGTFDKFYFSDTILTKVDSNTYHRTSPDGSIEIYSRAVGVTAGKRNVFLTRRLDTHGQAMDFVYDTDPSYPWRLKFVVDASGLATELFYELPSSPGFVTRVRDPFGRQAIFAYTGNFLQSITDPVGITSSFGYQDSRISLITTPYGVTKVRRSDPLNVARRWVEVEDPYGARERMEFRSDGAGIADIPTPDAFGNVFQRLYQDYRNTFYWDKKAMGALNGAPSSPEDYSKARRFHWLHLASSAEMSAVLENEKRPLEGAIYYKYPGQLSTEGQLTQTGTSAQPSAMHRFVEDGNGGVAVSAERLEYNNKGRVTKRIDPVGRETTYEYDTNGIDLRFVRQRVGNDYQTIKEIQYNPSFPPRLPWKVIDAAGQTTTYGYNSRAQVIFITNALNETTTFAYEDDIGAADFGKLKSITGALSGATTSFTYDGAQRIRTVTDSSPYTLTYDYDNLDRVTRVTYPDGTFEQTTYDKLDPVKRRDRFGRVTETRYNAIRQPVVTIDPAQRVLQMEYCSCGSMETLIDGNGNRTSWDFDVQGRQVSKRYADGKGDDFAYEPLSGRLSSITDAKGQIKNFTYNLDGTLRRLDYQNEQITTPDVTYTYDPNFNRISTVVDGIGTHAYSYYAAGVPGALQMHTLDGPFSDPVPLTDLITYSYDELGRVKTRNIGPSGTENKITWNYDALGRTISEINNLCTPGTQFTYNYIGTTGRLQSVDYPNGQRTAYDYWPATTPAQPGNCDFRLKQIANFGQGIEPATLLSRFDYTYDPAGNIATWGRKLGAAATEQTYTFGYDDAEQLTRAILSEGGNPDNLLYRYYAIFDRAGNRLSKQEGNTLTGYSFNNLNQLVSGSSGGKAVVAGHTDEPTRVTVNSITAKLVPGDRFEAFVPVVAGENQLDVTATDFASPGNTRTKSWSVNMESIANIAASYDLNGNLTSSSGTTYTYDASDQLVAVQNGEGARTLHYDGFGRLAVERLNGAVYRRLVWEHDAPAEVRRGENSESSDAIFQRGFKRIESSPTESSNFYTTLDHLGSVREISSINGSCESRVDYSISGNPVVTVQDLNAPVGFTGLISVAGQSLLVARNRIYEIGSATWLQRDPVVSVDRGVSSLYVYTSNNPIKFTDPSGLSSCDPCGQAPTNGHAGWVKCVGSKPMLCASWPQDTPLNKILYTCLIAHEATHARDVPCSFRNTFPGDSLRGPQWSECKANGNELSCLTEAYSKTTDPVLRAKLAKAIKLQIEEVRTNCAVR